MLFVVKGIFEQNIKETTSKENILKLMPEIYQKADDNEIIKLLPYKTYIQLEKLIAYSKDSEDIGKVLKKTEYSEIRYLEESMIIVSRAKYGKYNYTLNSGVLKKLERVFIKENKEIAKRYGEIESLIVGLLYCYEIVELKFFRQQICKCMNEIISGYELNDFYYKRLNLNTMVAEYPIKRVNSNTIELFITCLNEELIDVGDIAREQKARGLKYKIFSKQQILNRKEFYWDQNVQEFYDFMKDYYEYYWQLKTILKQNEYGKDILPELWQHSIFENDEEINKFMQLFNKWYNNSLQYMLGGYSPAEFGKKFGK